MQHSQKRTLNIGCGNSTYGTDFVDIYPTRKEVKKCDVDKEKLPYKDSTFDEVYSSFVFEHLRNPNLALKEMFRVLKKGGKIELHTNNAGWLFYHNSKSKVKTHYGGYEKKQGGFDRKEDEIGDRHFALYTFHHLENHLKDVGFKDVKSELYRRDSHLWRRSIRWINWLLENSRFKWASYPQIKIEAVK